MAREPREFQRQRPMTGDTLAAQLQRRWPPLCMLPSATMEWLVDALDRLPDAGALSLRDAFLRRPDLDPLTDSFDNRLRLLDLLAEVRTGADLAEHGFYLDYEAAGRDSKTVDFRASSLDLQVWVEVKRLNPDKEERKWLEAFMTGQGACTLVWYPRDDVRLGRLVRAAAEKMPDNTDPNVVVIKVEGLGELCEDARMYLLGRQGEVCDLDEWGRQVTLEVSNDGSGRWCGDSACPLCAVVLAASAPDGPCCGPLTKVMFVNPRRETEAQRILERWPMAVYRSS